jgi:hypothetical protein
LAQRGLSAPPSLWGMKTSRASQAEGAVA